MNLKPGKCHFISIGKDSHGEDVFYYHNYTLKNCNEEKILGIIIDRKLTFRQCIKKYVVKQVKLRLSHWDVLPKKVK